MQSTGSTDNAASRQSTYSRRIFILGIGNVGKLFAHAIAGIPDRPPITLLLRSITKLRNWMEAGCSIELISDGMSDFRRGFEVELPTLQDLQAAADNADVDPAFATYSASGDKLEGDVAEEYKANESIIHQLIVSVKAPFTVIALQGVARRLTRESTILFTQNGIGMIDEVNQMVFPDEETRPNYVVGVITHGITAVELKNFSIIHAGMGTTAVGILPRRSMLQPWTSADVVEQTSPSARYLVRTLTRTSALNAVGFFPTEILQMQLEKLAINSIINPLTALYECKNGEIIDNFSLRRVMRLLLAETSLVIRSLPELQGVVNVALRFAPGRLESLVLALADKTAANVSSMLQDVKAGRRTEIHYLNGYIVRRGEELGIQCALNYMLMQLVKGKEWTERARDADMLPFQLTNA